MKPHLLAVIRLASEHAGVAVDESRIAARVISAPDPDAQLERELAWIERDATRAA